MRIPFIRRSETRRLNAFAASLFVSLTLIAGARAQKPTGLIRRPTDSSAAPEAAAGLKAAPGPRSDTAILPAGLPLRIQLEGRYRMRLGAPVTGTLIAPVYAGNDIVLPVNTIFRGTISGFEPIERNTRTWALLDGDVTPLKRPVLRFRAFAEPGGHWLPLDARATDRTAAVVKMHGPEGKESLIGKAKAQVEAKKQTAEDAIHSPHKSDFALKFFYGQLPYHPQEIWAGTQFDAVLRQPLAVPDALAAKQLPAMLARGHLPPGTLDVRLLDTISSATNKVGNPVHAVLTEPYFNATKTGVVLQTGTPITGVITQAKPARMLGRNGTLRFAFRTIQLPNGGVEKMHGQMTAVEGAKGQHLTVDSEGGAKANAGPGQILAPLLLGVLASNSLDSDQGAVHAGVSSNGFGLVTRIIAFAVVTPTMTATFAYYALGKSITRRWIMPGHNVVFAKNTRMELSVADR